MLTDQEGVRAGLDRTVEKSFGDSGLVLGSTRDPVRTGSCPVRDLRVLYRERGFDALVAVGSGSV